MWETIFFIILIFLFLIGLSEVIYFLGSLVFKPKIKPEKYLVVHLSETCAEQQILSELFRIRWYGMKIAEKIIFLTDDLSDTELERLAKEYKSDITEFKNGVFNER